MLLIIYNLSILLISIILIFSIILKLYTRLTVGRCTSKRNLSGMIIIVTGCNSGIGLETVKELAMRNANIIMACRNLTKGQTALNEVVKETGINPSQLKLKELDLSSLSSIRRFVSKVLAEESRLDVLINNAGTFIQERMFTKEDQLELNLVTNYLGPFLLTNLLLGLMIKNGATACARIVNVSSEAHKFLSTFDVKNLNLMHSTTTSWEPMTNYVRTKLALILFTRELARRLAAANVNNIYVNAINPGAVKTSILQNNNCWYMKILVGIGQYFFKTAEEGAQTTIHAAIGTEAQEITGGYFMDCKMANVSKLAQDSKLAKNLWETSIKLVQLKPEEEVLLND